MSVASSVVVVFALIFWSFQLAPQAFLNYRNASTVGLSPLLLLSWSIGSALTAVNNIATGLSALFIIQPNLFLVFSITCFAQCYYYPNHHSQIPTPLRAVVAASAVTLLALAVELSLSLTLLHADIDDPSSPSLLAINILSLIGFVVGFAPQYWLIAQQRCVRGVSLLFLAIDMTGAILSTVALALTDDFAVVEAVSYIGVFVLDAGIVILSFILAESHDTHKQHTQATQLAAQLSSTTIEANLETMTKPTHTAVSRSLKANDIPLDETQVTIDST